MQWQGDRHGAHGMHWQGNHHSTHGMQWQGNRHVPHWIHWRFLARRMHCHESSWSSWKFIKVYESSWKFMNFSWKFMKVYEKTIAKHNNNYYYVNLDYQVRESSWTYHEVHESLWKFFGHVRLRQHKRIISCISSWKLPPPRQPTQIYAPSHGSCAENVNHLRNCHLVISLSLRKGTQPNLCCSFDASTECVSVYACFGQMQ